jgi:hypothetical protein
MPERNEPIAEAMCSMPHTSKRGDFDFNLIIRTPNLKVQYRDWLSFSRPMASRIFLTHRATVIRGSRQQFEIRSSIAHRDPTPQTPVSPEQSHRAAPSFIRHGSLRSRSPG